MEIPLIYIYMQLSWCAIDVGCVAGASYSKCVQNASAYTRICGLRESVTDSVTLAF